MDPCNLQVLDLGMLDYASAYEQQVTHVDQVLAARERGGECGRVLLLEHPDVITVSRRAGAADHLLASPQVLAAQGVQVCETDRGGDITYHGPGQLVAYPILDLNVLNLGLHAYMRMLEQVVIDTCGVFGVVGERDASATGVWVRGSKVCAMGVRIRKWVSMHGLAINVNTDLSRFGLIVPCGLHGRPVTSLAALLGGAVPTMRIVKQTLAENLQAHVRAAFEAARAARTS